MIAVLSRLSPLVVFAGLTACVHTQAPSVTPPQYWRVRVHVMSPTGADGVMVQGVVVWATEDSLRIYDEAALTHRILAATVVARIDIYRGQRATAGTAAKGALAGAGVGAFLGALAGGASSAVVGAIFDTDPNLDEALVYGAVEGAVYGAGAGLAAGATLGEAHWQTITYHDLREEMCHCRISPAAVPQ